MQGWGLAGNGGALTSVRLILGFGESLNTKPLSTARTALGELSKELDMPNDAPLFIVDVEEDPNGNQRAETIDVGISYATSDGSLEVQVIRDSVLLQYNRYPGWATFRSVAEKILRGPAQVYFANVPFVEMRLEYRNRFMTTATEGEVVAPYGHVIRTDTPYLPPGFASRGTPWRNGAVWTDEFDGRPTTTALVIEAGKGTRKISEGEQHPARHLIMIASNAVRATATGSPDDEDETAPTLVARLPILHDAVKSLVARTITDSAAALIGLNDRERS